MLVDQDAFSSSQILSKIWLVETLEDILRYKEIKNPLKILVLGGWYCLTNLIIRLRKNIKIDKVINVDIDADACDVAKKLNETWVWQNQFESLVYNVNIYQHSGFDVIINTSVEHLETNEWFENIPKDTIVVLQSNDMKHDDHYNNHKSLNDFIENYPLTDILYDGVKMFQYKDHSFQRYMIIGIK